MNWSSVASIKQDSAVGNSRQSSGAAPNYTHPLILACVRTFGASPTLFVLLNEATKSISAGNYQPEIALDVLTAIVCAPTAPSARSTLSLRQALQLALEGAYGYSVGKNGQRADPTKAELIVRLSRRVEAQSPAQQVPQQAAVEVPDPIVTGDVAGDMMLGLEGNPELASGGGIDGSGMGAAAATNEALEGILKDVDSAGLGDLMDTSDAVDLFDFN